MDARTVEALMRKEDESAKLAVIELAVQTLGRLALIGPSAYLSPNERAKLNQILFECLEVLNDEKDTYGTPTK